MTFSSKNHITKNLLSYISEKFTASMISLKKSTVEMSWDDLSYNQPWSPNFTKVKQKSKKGRRRYISLTLVIVNSDCQSASTREEEPITNNSNYISPRNNNEIKLAPNLTRSKNISPPGMINTRHLLLVILKIN